MNKRDRIISIILMVLCVVLSVLSIVTAWYTYATGGASYLVVWNLVNFVWMVSLVFGFIKLLD